MILLRRFNALSKIGSRLADTFYVDAFDRDTRSTLCRARGISRHEITPRCFVYLARDIFRFFFFRNLRVTATREDRILFCERLKSQKIRAVIKTVLRSARNNEILIRRFRNRKLIEQLLSDWKFLIRNSKKKRNCCTKLPRRENKCSENLRHKNNLLRRRKYGKNAVK